MNKFIILNIDMSYGELHETIHPVVLCDETNCVLVDCGYVGALPKMEEALLTNDILPENITHIIITHQDHDHVGAAAAFVNKYPDVKILASAEEAPYISGTHKSLRLKQAEQLQKELPENMQEFGQSFCRLLRSVEPVQIDQLLYDDEWLPFGGGCQVISTPGHTPGHISLYLSEFNTMIAGDAIALEAGKPVIANPQFTLDFEKANASLQLLLVHPAQRIVCYHGGLLEKNCEHRHGMEKDYFMRTERIGFSNWTDADLELAIQLWGEKEVTQYICATGEFTKQDILNRLNVEIDNGIKYQVQYWPIFDLSTGELIGCCGLRPFQSEQHTYEIGFHLRKLYWGQGYAFEAATRVIQYAFTKLSAVKLYAGHHPQNIGSRKLLTRLGFHYIGDNFYEPTGLYHPSYEMVGGL